MWFAALLGTTRSGQREALESFRTQVLRAWLRALRRRGQRRCIDWVAWAESPALGAPRACTASFPTSVLTPEPRQEPGALAAHAGIVRGAAASSDEGRPYRDHCNAGAGAMSVSAPWSPCVERDRSRS